MRWSNVFVIFRRELRDQARDRRTLFMVFVFPILLYPLLGIGIVQFSAAFEQKPRNVLVIGVEALPASPPLLTAEADGFAPTLFDTPAEATRLKVRAERAEGPWLDRKASESLVREGVFDAVVFLPSDLRAQLDTNHSAGIPIAYESRDERSQFTYLRVKEVLSRWKESVLNARLERDNKPASYAEPIQIKAEDVTPASEAGRSVWARLFPFLLVTMALTGAFYPAVDLCAGEKERGTMETLLISPASRPEIVMGKFLTVVAASMLTALLNLVSMGLTGLQLAHQIGAGAANAGGTGGAAVFAPPTLISIAWMLLLLVPLSAFFSALCLALAVLARSMKEGQYYMTPLYMISLPLIMLTMAPGVELNAFYSLIPISGVALLLRSLILGDYGVAARYSVPVLVPTMIYGALALRLAIEQFEREDVIFRESERFDLRLWVRHLIRDKRPLPTGGQAAFCFLLMVATAWFLTQFLGAVGLATTIVAMVVAQFAIILLPPVVMGGILTRSPRRTLRLYGARGRDLAIASALAFSLNPVVSEIQPVVEQLFPLSETTRSLLESLLSVPSLGTALVVIAVVPAICEEVAFRGFILSAFESGRSTWTAIALSSILFGLIHVVLSLFQQLFNATLLGLVLGLIAVRSGSILPGILFHFLNNGLAVIQHWQGTRSAAGGLSSWLYRNPAQGQYRWWIVGLAVLVSSALLVRLYREPTRVPWSRGGGEQNSRLLETADMLP